MRAAQRDGPASSIRLLRGNGGKIREISLTLRTSRFSRDSHERIARFYQVFGSQLMIYFQTGSECGKNEAVWLSRTFSFVLPASSALTCGCCHTTVHTDQAAWGMVAGWMAPHKWFWMLNNEQNARFINKLTICDHWSFLLYFILRFFFTHFILEFIIIYWQYIQTPLELF